MAPLPRARRRRQRRRRRACAPPPRGTSLGALARLRLVRGGRARLLRDDDERRPGVVLEEERGVLAAPRSGEALVRALRGRCLLQGRCLALPRLPPLFALAALRLGRRNRVGLRRAPTLVAPDRLLQEPPSLSGLMRYFNFAFFLILPFWCLSGTTQAPKKQNYHRHAGNSRSAARRTRPPPRSRLLVCLAHTPSGLAIPPPEVAELDG